MRLMGKAFMEEHTSGDSDRMWGTIGQLPKSRRNLWKAKAAAFGWGLGWWPGRNGLEVGLEMAKKELTGGGWAQLGAWTAAWQECIRGGLPLVKEKFTDGIWVRAWPVP